MNMPKPSKNEVLKYLTKWDFWDSYVLQESSLKKLFTIMTEATSEIICK